MVVKLFPRTDNSPFLSAAQVAERIQNRFSDSVVDWKSAADNLQSELENLIRIGAPPPIIQGHRNLFGNVVAIGVHSGPEASNGFDFTVCPDSILELCSIRAVCNRDSDEMQKLALEIAKCLDYEAEFID